MTAEGLTWVERTFAFVDLAGFTALAEAHGDEEAAFVASRLATYTRDLLIPGVELVKSLGDAVMLAGSGPEPTLETVERLADACARSQAFLGLRGGLHHGVAIRVDGDYFGRAVNMTARVAGLAAAGHLLLTAAVARRVGDRPLGRLGVRQLRDVADPVELFRLSLEADPTVVDPVCRMHLDPATAIGHLTHEAKELWFCSLECVSRFSAAPALYAKAADRQ